MFEACLCVVCRDDFERVLAGRSFAFSLLVHTDMESPMIDFLEASSVLQVWHPQAVAVACLAQSQGHPVNLSQVLALITACYVSAPLGSLNVAQDLHSIPAMIPLVPCMSAF